MKTTKKFYFAGIGGSGMSSLAQILSQRGNWVGGSDRNFDRKLNMRFFRKLQAQGIFLFPQHENSLPEHLDAFVVSTAIEKNSGEMNRAQSRGIPVLHRAQLLGELFNASVGIGIAGTSGKTTVTGMVASILEAADKDPTVINGGLIKQYISKNLIGNAKNGGSDLLVSEVDESDGSIIRFHPAIGIVTNISKDHKELSELRQLFQTFLSHTSRQVILNGDCHESVSLKTEQAITFGLGRTNTVAGYDVEHHEMGVRFTLRGTTFSLRVPGVHNVYNALAAAAVALALEIPLPKIQKGLASFKGIQRRLALVGSRHGIRVIDDFAHNPDKITASLTTLKAMGGRIISIFQPHGYGPTRFLLKELGSAFSTALSTSDIVLCLNIYDAGGTADRSITSMDLVRAINGPRALYIQERNEVISMLKKVARPGDSIVVMGARDDTLSVFARKILRDLR